VMFCRVGSASLAARKRRAERAALLEASGDEKTR